MCLNALLFANGRRRYVVLFEPWCYCDHIRGLLRVRHRIHDELLAVSACCVCVCMCMWLLCGCGVSNVYVPVPVVCRMWMWMWMVVWMYVHVHRVHDE